MTLAEMILLVWTCADEGDEVALDEFECKLRDYLLEDSEREAVEKVIQLARIVLEDGGIC